MLKCPFAGLKQQMIFHCLLVHGQFTFIDRTPSEVSEIKKHTKFLKHVDFCKTLKVRKAIAEAIVKQQIILYFSEKTLYRRLPARKFHQTSSWQALSPIKCLLLLRQWKHVSSAPEVDENAHVHQCAPHETSQWHRATLWLYPKSLQRKPCCS